MSNHPLTLSGLDAALPQEAEYDAVYAAVTATERGRWFLTEFANRNRHADTDSLIAAIARIEAAVRSDAPAKESTRRPDVSAAAERLADIAFALRERGAEATLCDALDAALREICDACETGVENHDADNGVARPTEPAVVAAIQTAPGAARQPEGGADGGNEDSISGHFDFELQDSEKFAEAATALAASLGALTDEAEAPRKPQIPPSRAVIPQHDYGPPTEPQAPEAADRAPRWFIEAPGFVFQPPKQQTNGHDVETSGRSGQVPALLPEPQPPPDLDEDPADLFESTPQLVAIPVHSSPTPSTVIPAQDLSVVVVSAPAATVQTAEIPPPQPQFAAAATVRHVPRPVPANPLGALRALTEEELIALFG